MVIIAESNKSKEIRGIILADCTTIEMELSRFLSDYFGDDKSKKQELYDLIFNTELVRFHKKIEIFKRIVDTDFYSEREELVKYLDWLRKTRNSVAHWTWNSEKSQDGFSVLKNPLGDKSLKIDDDLLNEHERKVMVILQFFDAYFS